MAVIAATVTTPRPGGIVHTYPNWDLTAVQEIAPISLMNIPPVLNVAFTYRIETGITGGTNPGLRAYVDAGDYETPAEVWIEIATVTFAGGKYYDRNSNPMVIDTIFGGYVTPVFTSSVTGADLIKPIFGKQLKIDYTTGSGAAPTAGSLHELSVHLMWDSRLS